MSTITGWFVIQITRPDESGYLCREKIPWWRGGGHRHILQKDVTDSDLLNWQEVGEYKEMDSRIPQTTIEVFSVELIPVQH